MQTVTLNVMHVEWWLEEKGREKKKPTERERFFSNSSILKDVEFAVPRKADLRVCTSPVLRSDARSEL